MTSKIKDHITEAINESKKQVEEILDKSGKVVEMGSKAAEKAREKASEAAAAGVGTINKISEKMHKENLVRMAESVREEVRNTLFAEMLSEIARLKDDTDELRRRMADMQKAYDRKISDLQSQMKATRPKPSTKPEATKKPASKTTRKPASKTTGRKTAEK